MKENEEALQARLLCNCGLLLRNGARSILIDCPNRSYSVFQTLEPQLKNMLYEEKGPFRFVDGILFTHTHPDHCDVDAVKRYVHQRPKCRCFFPSYDEKNWGVLTTGEFEVEFGYLSHMESPEEMKKHYVFLITCKEKSIYITADAQADPMLHQEFLKGRKVDAAFWNPLYLTSREMRNWMNTAANHSYVYHLPPDIKDELGIRRKAELCCRRYPETLKNFQLLTDYPSEWLTI